MTEKNDTKIKVIIKLNNDGNHILSDGTIARVVTDEKLKVGDYVVAIKDNKGDFNILGGKK